MILSCKLELKKKTFPVLKFYPCLICIPAVLFFLYVAQSDKHLFSW